MGIRNMQPYKYLPMQLPYCVFEVTSCVFFFFVVIFSLDDENVRPAGDVFRRARCRGARCLCAVADRALASPQYGVCPPIESKSPTSFVAARTWMDDQRMLRVPHGIFSEPYFVQLLWLGGAGVRAGGSRIQVDDMDGTKRSVLTDSSNKPTGRDANFLQVTNAPPLLLARVAGFFVAVYRPLLAVLEKHRPPRTPKYGCKRDVFFWGDVTAVAGNQNLCVSRGMIPLGCWNRR